MKKLSLFLAAVMSLGTIAMTTACGEAEETIYVDTGFISQNIYLHCASEGLATVVRAMVPKESLAAALGLAPTQEITLVQTVGWAQ